MITELVFAGLFAAVVAYGVYYFWNGKTISIK